jgi:hypothetical protein
VREEVGIQGSKKNVEGKKKVFQGKFKREEKFFFKFEYGSYPTFKNFLLIV